MYVCVCKAVTDQDIRRAIAEGAHCFRDLQARTGCSTCCGCCEQEARALLQASLAEAESVAEYQIAA